jgi:CHRD domain
MKPALIAGSALVVALGLGLAGCESDRGSSGAMGGGMARASSGTTLGAQLTNPNNPSAKGDATVMVDQSSKTAKWTVNYGGLSGPATMAHFHGPAAPGQNAPPVVWLSPKGQPVPPGTIQGQETLTDEQMADLLAGKYYINVHTAANPGGEIRGQVTPR